MIPAYSTDPAVTALSARVEALERLSQAERPQAASRVTCRLVIELVSLESGVSQSLILSDQRAAHIARPRAIAIWLCCHVTGKSLPQIGRVFDRDHTSILAAREKVEQLRISDNSVFAQTDRLRSLFLGVEP